MGFITSHGLTILFDHLLKLCFHPSPPMINTYQKTQGLCEWTEQILTRWLPRTRMGDAFLSDFVTKHGKFLAVNVLKETTD